MALKNIGTTLDEMMDEMVNELWELVPAKIHGFRDALFEDRAGFKVWLTELFYKTLKQIWLQEGKEWDSTDYLLFALDYTNLDRRPAWKMWGLKRRSDLQPALKMLGRAWQGQIKVGYRKRHSGSDFIVFMIAHPGLPDRPPEEMVPPGNL